MRNAERVTGHLMALNAEGTSLSTIPRPNAVSAVPVISHIDEKDKRSEYLDFADESEIFIWCIGRQSRKQRIQ